jgi:hypothetical protein
MPKLEIVREPDREVRLAFRQARDLFWIVKCMCQSTAKLADGYADKYQALYTEYGGTTEEDSVLSVQEHDPRSDDPKPLKIMKFAKTEEPIEA